MTQILYALVSARLRGVALAAVLFAFVLGANWAVVDRFGSDMPDWDQWDAEGMNLLIPWFEHDHFAQHLFEPHNEHRVVLTKLQNLVLTLLNGQWDARLECAGNAALHAALAVGFWLLERRIVERRWQAPLYIILAALFGLPLAWQNLLGGFHSQQYWLLGLSFAAIVTLPFAYPWSGRWWFGLGAMILALGSMGSGFLAAVAVFVLALWRWLRRELNLRTAGPTLLLSSAIIAIGDLTRVEVSYHEHLKAKTAHDFVFSLLRSLEWPLRDHDAAGALLWLPWLIVTWWALRFPRSRNSAETRRGRAAQIIATLGGWVLIQIVATAYARGAGAEYPASRYMDTLIFGMAVNGLALGWLLSAPSAEAVSGMQRPLRAACGGLAVAWVTALGFGLWPLTTTNLRDELPNTKHYYAEAETHLLGYLTTNDRAELINPIPYPSAGTLAGRLEHAALRTLMPVSVRPSLPLTPASEKENAFARNETSPARIDTAARHGLAPPTPPLASRVTWGSFNRAGVANIREWQSTPLTAPLGGWLKFETAGDLGRDGVALELRDAATHALIANVRPTHVPEATWRAAYVRAPRAPFVVVARDSDAARWLAFSAPAEMAPLSFYAWQATKNGWLLATGAAVFAALIAVGALVDRPASAEMTPTTV